MGRGRLPRFPMLYDAWLKLVCRTVGCTSVFARWFVWPHKHVCSPLVLRQYEKDEALRG